MVHRRLRASGASGRGSRSRSTLRVFLTESELAELDRAVTVSGAWTRSLLVAEAIHAGLLRPNLTLTSDKRCQKVNVRVSAKIVNDLRQLASAHNVTQQAVLRHFLFRYIASAPWKLWEERALVTAGQQKEAVVR